MIRYHGSATRSTLHIHVEHVPLFSCFAIGVGGKYKGITWNVRTVFRLFKLKGHKSYGKVVKIHWWLLFSKIKECRREELFFNPDIRHLCSVSVSGLTMVSISFPFFFQFSISITSLFHVFSNCWGIARKKKSAFHFNSHVKCNPEIVASLPYKLCFYTVKKKKKKKLQRCYFRCLRLRELPWF